MKLAYQPHPVYSKPGTVVIVVHKNKRRCLEEAVEKSGFMEHLHRKWQASGRPKEEFRIAIKPNIMTAAYETDISVYTDPQLVEHLIDMMRAEGHRRFAVVESHNVWGLYFEGRTLESVADMVGYSKNGYDLVDLTLTKEPHHYGDNELGQHVVGPAWRDADYRISFAKNKTHWQCYYTGCLKNIYGCLPEMDKMKAYHGHRREFHSCTILIHEAFPVDFAFLDAYWSGDGFAGHVRDNVPNKTNTIICGENCFAVDWVQGEKMGLDPRKNYVIRRAIERWGEIEIDRIGDRTPFPNWKNLQPYVDTLTNLIEEVYVVSYFFSRLLAYRIDPRYREIKKYRWFFRILRFPVKLVDDHAKAILNVLILLLMGGFVFGVLQIQF